MNNTCELIGHYGSDKTHACSAWTSTSRELTDEKISRIPALLEMLADNRHDTPFEKSLLHFLVRVDTATHIHILKHRIGVSVNGESARYKELKHEGGYVPDDWSNGAATVEEDSLALQSWANRLEAFTAQAQELYHASLNELTPILGRARAKESARFFLPYATQVTLDVSFNFRSFAHFYRLRADRHAQREIRLLAKDMLRQVEAIPGNPFADTITALKLHTIAALKESK